MADKMLQGFIVVAQCLITRITEMSLAPKNIVEETLFIFYLL